MKMLGFTAGASTRGGTQSNARGAELGLRLGKDREGLWGAILESEIVSKVSRGGFSFSQQAGGAGEFVLTHHHFLSFASQKNSISAEGAQCG